MYVVMLLAALILIPRCARAHNPITSTGNDAIAAGLTALIVLLLWVGYIVGAKRATPSRWRAYLLHITTVITLFTILGPLDEMAEQSASAHMVQHMFMMVVIAPAFALARPLPQYFRLLGSKGKSLLKWAFTITQYPMVCTFVHGVTIWFWHIPYFYMLAVDNPWVHIFEHAMFLVTAIWFWWACLHAYARRFPNALLALLTTLMHTGFLGALMTFANAPFYGEARHLEDQQIAGLIMWVVGGTPYIIAALWAGNRWYRQLERESL